MYEKMNMSSLKHIPGVFKAVCTTAVACTVILASVTVQAENPPPFPLPHDPVHEEKTSIHTLPPDHDGNPTGYETGFTSQVYRYAPIAIIIIIPIIIILVARRRRRNARDRISRLAS